MTLIEKAMRLALAAHAGQVRKNDSSPYIVHPVMVSMLLQAEGFPEEVVAAALTHDVLEDTTVPPEELRQTIGDEAFSYVVAVSEDQSLLWEERKEQYVKTVVAGPHGAKAVSIADKIHNAQSILKDYEEKGSAVWQVFHRGKDKKMWFEEMLYSEVSAVWEHPLLDQYRVVLDQLHQIEA